MAIVTLSALAFSAIIYLYIGFSLGKYNKNLSDLFPVVFGTNARVNTVDEFSNSTVATTVSLATIVLAYFELAGYFGLYLLWTVLTTAIGMLIVSLVSKRIWQKMSAFSHRPSLHEFLGIEYNSPSVALIASVCTSIGFLLIFATELIVGSRFLAKLVPTIPEWITVVFLSSVGFIYTLYGGFRAVIKTDQLQMKFIWALIIGLTAYYIYYVLENGGLAVRLAKVPNGILDFSPRAGLGSFLFGIAVMNIPTHISNMSIWQRIAGAQKPEIMEKGVRNSIWGLVFSWGMLTLLACFAYLIVSPQNSQGLLTDLLITMGDSIFGRIILFIVVLGLYGAMLSTASTNLIVVTHTVSEDIFAKFKTATLSERINSQKEFLSSRLILVSAAVLAIFLVEGLKYVGFSVADLVFAIYGGSLALFPPIIVALYSERSKLKVLSSFATIGVILGFLSGWGTAICGKIIAESNLIFLSPAVSIASSFLILFIGLMLKKEKQHQAG